MYHAILGTKFARISGYGQSLSWNACDYKNQKATGFSKSDFELPEMVYGSFHSSTWPDLRNYMSSFLKSQDSGKKQVEGKMGKQRSA